MVTSVPIMSSPVIYNGGLNPYLGNNASSNMILPNQNMVGYNNAIQNPQIYSNLPNSNINNVPPQISTIPPTMPVTY